MLKKEKYDKMTKQKPQKCYWFNIAKQESIRDNGVYKECKGCRGYDTKCAFYFPRGSKVVNQPSELEVEVE